jgi:hypothetical protein
MCAKTGALLRVCHISIARRYSYTCPGCAINAWAKPEVHLVCGDCDERMEAK